MSRFKRKSKEELNQERETFLSRPSREVARSFLDEFMLLIEKYDMLNKNRNGPAVCVTSLSSEEIKVFVKWPFDSYEEQNGVGST